ncbi:hypothetical protein BDF14DRAFT_1802009 [Spinellus fusiger]|nr:hypothetical protein BDF14DRAFT_1802009 [Spinellus fusiger]
MYPGSSKKQSTVRYTPSTETFSNRHLPSKNASVARIYRKNALFRPEESTETEMEGDTPSEIMNIDTSPRYSKASRVTSDELSQLRSRIKMVERDFKELIHLRYTEPETSLNELEKCMAARTQAADGAIESLKQIKEGQDVIIKELETRLAEAQKTVEVLEIQKQKTANETETSTVDFYQYLTGMTLTDVTKTEKETIYTCEQQGKTGNIQFKLIQPMDPQQGVHYEPILDKQHNAHFISTLPDFVKHKITFNTDSLQKFYTLLNQSLQSETENINKDTLLQP